MEFSRESIFVSALRSFARMFFAVCGLFLAFVLCSIVYASLSSSSSIEEKTSINYLPDAAGKREVVSHTAPVVLQINIQGVIGEPKTLDTEVIQNILLDSRTGTLSADRVKAILLHLNTPGGTVVDSDNIYRLLLQYKERYKVPVFAYVSGMCASGGMYIASAADQIFAGPASIVGSVGVILGPFFNVYDAMGKIGVQARTLTQGLDKDMMNPTRPWREGEDASLKAVTAYFYQQFVNIVTSARPRLDKEKLVSEYGAQVFDPVEAERLGYIDFANASRDLALLALLKEAHIDPSTPYQVIELQSKNLWISSLFKSTSPFFTGKIEHSIDLGGPKIRDKVAYLYQPGEN
ncbi:MAG: S49 family peptidase [Chlamydiota bacterium]